MSVTGHVTQIGQEGMANLAHAVRRSTALYVAMSVSIEGTSDEELLARADRFAAWIRGSAVPDSDVQDFLGKNPWQS